MAKHGFPVPKVLLAQITLAPRAIFVDSINVDGYTNVSSEGHSAGVAVEERPIVVAMDRKHMDN